MVSAGRFYRFEHIVSYSSGKVVAKSDGARPHIAREEQPFEVILFLEELFSVFDHCREPDHETLVSISLALVRFFRWLDRIALARPSLTKRRCHGFNLLPRLRLDRLHGSEKVRMSHPGAEIRPTHPLDHRLRHLFTFA